MTECVAVHGWWVSIAWAGESARLFTTTCAVAYFKGGEPYFESSRIGDRNLRELLSNRSQLKPDAIWTLWKQRGPDFERERDERESNASARWCRKHGSDLGDKAQRYLNEQWLTRRDDDRTTP